MVHLVGGTGPAIAASVDTNVIAASVASTVGVNVSALSVGSEQLVCNGSSDLYVVSYDADGNQLWAKSWGGDNSGDDDSDDGDDEDRGY